MNHQGEIEATETGYTAICSCTWTGEEQKTKWAAEQEMESHLEKVTESL